MNAGELVKFALLGALALLLWSWLRTGAHLNLGPGENGYGGYGGGYGIQQPGTTWAGGFIPFRGGQGGGFTFGTNVPWN
jgi:hypothetical protein